MNPQEKRQIFHSLIILSSVIILFALISYLFFYLTARKAIHKANYSEIIIHYADSLGFTDNEMITIINHLEAENMQTALELCLSDTIGNPYSRYRVFLANLKLPEETLNIIYQKLPVETGNYIISELLKIDRLLPEFFPDIKKDLLKTINKRRLSS